MNWFSAIFSNLSVSSTAHCSGESVDWQLGFQMPASPIAEGVMNLHHDLMFLVILIALMVGWIMWRTLSHFSVEKNPTPATFTHGTFLEIAWTLIPTLILLTIAIPSFALLYSMDEVTDPGVTLKAIGKQWYWTYEFSDYVSKDGETYGFDSFMVADDDLKPGDFRLLEVDNEVVLPVNTHIRILVSAADVLHCFALPSLGVKVDGCPGRLNQTSMFINRVGTYRGQCSEICGANHAFMPIVIKAVELKEYVAHILEETESDAWVEENRPALEANNLL